MNGILAERLRGRHPADTHLRFCRNGSPGLEEPASFLDGPMAQIEHSDVLLSRNGPRQEPIVVFQRPGSSGGTPSNEKAPGKHYIKNIELTTLNAQ